MNTDISLCTNHSCPLRYNCYRYLAVPAKGSNQSYTRFEPNKDDTCDWFMKYNEENPQEKK